MSRSVTKAYEFADMDGNDNTPPVPCDTLRWGRATLTADTVPTPYDGDLLVQVSNAPAPDQSRRQTYAPPEESYVTVKTVPVSLSVPGTSVDTDVFDLVCTYVRILYQPTSGEGTATLRVTLTGDEE